MGVFGLREWVLVCPVVFLLGCMGKTGSTSQQSDDTGDGGQSGQSDADGDGWTPDGGDCDDTDSSIHPEAVEVCDGDDNDCDGTYYEGETLDEDGDGFPSCDDCDDTTIWVNPGWDEQADDGVDNDCDGRVDEEWAGVAVSYLNENEGESSSILLIDSVGRLEDEITLDEGVLPTWLDHGVESGFVVNSAYVELVEVAEDGTSAVIADFSDTDYGFYGLTTHPDGYYLVTLIDSLVRVDSDGTTEELASWSIDTMDPKTFDMIVYTLAVSQDSGEVGLFGLYGGFGTWTEEDGLTIHRRANVKKWDGSVTYSGAAKDGGGWFTAALDNNTGAYGVYRFNLETNEWVVKASWTDSQWLPNVLTIDGDNGDYYVTANAGWYYTVWRIRDEDESAADLYITDGTVSGRSFEGLVSRY